MFLTDHIGRSCQIVRVFFFQAEDGIRYLVRSRGLGDVYKRQDYHHQLTLLRSLLRRNPARQSEQESVLEPGLSAKAKERIRRALDSSRS